MGHCRSGPVGSSAALCARTSRNGRASVARAGGRRAQEHCALRSGARGARRSGRSAGATPWPPARACRLARASVRVL
eukprot:2313574-Pleurochrysis_carterae.AAC.1